MLFFLVKNNLKLMLRDKIAMLFLILLPIVLIAILSSAFSEKLGTGYEMKPLIVGDSVEAGEDIKTNNGDLIHTKSFVKLESIKVDPLPSSTVYYGIVEIVFVIWFGMIVLSTIVNNERKYGVDRRIGITSVSSGTLFLGKLIPTVLAVSIQIGIAIIASTVLMEINWGSSPMLSAAAPSLIQRPDFPYGLKKEAVDEIIQGTYNDRPKMLRGFGEIFFFKYITDPFSEWFFSLGLQAASWATAEIAKTWLGEESLFCNLEEISVPTLILHGIHDKVCLFPLAKAQKRGIKNSKLVAFEDSGHGLFYDEKDKFNKELMEFIEG